MDSRLKPGRGVISGIGILYSSAVAGGGGGGGGGGGDGIAWMPGSPFGVKSGLRNFGTALGGDDGIDCIGRDVSRLLVSTIPFMNWMKSGLDVLKWWEVRSGLFT